MQTMSEFELDSHAEYAKKYLEHEVSFFEAMVIPPWANSFFGGTHHSDDDLLNIILAYKKHNVFLDVIKKTHPIIDILLYYRLLVYKKLLLSLKETEESNETIQSLCYLLTELSGRHSYFFGENLMPEKDMRVLLNILRLTRKLDSELSDPLMRYSKIKKMLSRFYRLMMRYILADEPNDLAFVAAYINPYFQKPGGSNSKITRAADEVFNYKKQADEWITEYSRVALVAIDRGKPDTFDVNTQNALYEAALHFDEVALAILNNEKVLKYYSAEEQAELQNHLLASQAEGILEEKTLPKESNQPRYLLSQTERNIVKKQATRLYHYFYRLSFNFFSRNSLKLTTNHFYDILTIILNNEQQILPIVADYWHKTYRQFRPHSHSTEFQKRFLPYINTIIDFFNDKDISENDDAMLKAFAEEFINKCKANKTNLQNTNKLSKRFEEILDHFIQLKT